MESPLTDRGGAQPKKDLTDNDQLTIKLLASYVPKLVVKQFQIKPEKITLPGLTVNNAALIFADISGFTPLTEKMSKLGTKGIELMSTHLNNFFDKLIGIIHLYGGDIIKFAGDAVMAVWLDTDERQGNAKLANLANLACQCSLALLQTLHNFTVEECILRLHIGIAAGSLGLVHVGGEKDCVEFLITGDPISDVGDCEKAAKPNEIFVSRRVVELIENDIKFSHAMKNKQKKKKLSQYPPEIGCFMLHEVKNAIPPKPADYLPTFYPKDIRPFLIPYIPPAITHRLPDGEKVRSGIHLSRNEMRVISVVFVSLEITIKNTTSEIQQLQEAVVAMQKDIFQYDGSVRQFLVDDKGSVMIAVFGTPPHAHEDDASRACMTAMAIQKSLANLHRPIRSKIGVTTGEAFLGDVGNAERREYAVVGDIVNLSARLMCAAPEGQIYVDEMTYKGALSNPRLSFITLNPIRVKGKTVEINVYRPKPDLINLILHAEKEQQMKFIGRTKELEKLQYIVSEHERTRDKDSSTSTPTNNQPSPQPSTALVSSAGQSSPSLQARAHAMTVLLEGEAGSGKTSTMNELIKRNSFSFLRGNAHALELQTPFFVWSEIGVKLFGLETYSGTSALESAPLILKTVQNWFNSHTKDAEILNMIPVLSSVLPFNCENQHTQNLTKDQRMEAVSKLLSFALNRSTFSVIILENLQWFDQQSLGYLPRVIKDCVGKLFLLTNRPNSNAESNSPEIQEVAKLPTTIVLEMGFMSIPELIEITKRNLKLEHVPPNLQRYFEERMALYPLPLLAKETAEQFLSKGIVELKPHKTHNKQLIGVVQLSKLVGLEAGTMIIPNSLRGIYTARVDNLTQSQQVVIKIASIIGTQFSTLLLHDILPSKGELTSARQKTPNSSVTQSDEASTSTSSIGSKKVTELRGIGLGGRMKDSVTYSDGIASSGGHMPRPKFNISSPNLKVSPGMSSTTGTESSVSGSITDSTASLTTGGATKENRTSSQGNRRQRPNSSNASTAPSVPDGGTSSAKDSQTSGDNASSNASVSNANDSTGSADDAEVLEKLNAMARAKRDNKKPSNKDSRRTSVSSGSRANQNSAPTGQRTLKRGSKNDSNPEIAVDVNKKNKRFSERAHRRSGGVTKSEIESADSLTHDEDSLSSNDLKAHSRDADSGKQSLSNSPLNSLGDSNTTPPMSSSGPVGRSTVSSSASAGSPYLLDDKQPMLIGSTSAASLVSEGGEGARETGVGDDSGESFSDPDEADLPFTALIVSQQQKQEEKQRGKNAKRRSGQQAEPIGNTVSTENREATGGVSGDEERGRLEKEKAARLAKSPRRITSSEGTTPRDKQARADEMLDSKQQSSGEDKSKEEKKDDSNTANSSGTTAKSPLSHVSSRSPRPRITSSDSGTTPVHLWRERGRSPDGRTSAREGGRDGCNSAPTKERKSARGEKSDGADEPETHEAREGRHAKRDKSPGGGKRRSGDFDSLISSSGDSKSTSKETSAKLTQSSPNGIPSPLTARGRDKSPMGERSPRNWRASGEVDPSGSPARDGPNPTIAVSSSNREAKDPADQQSATHETSEKTEQQSTEHQNDSAATNSSSQPRVTRVIKGRPISPQLRTHPAVKVGDGGHASARGSVSASNSPHASPSVSGDLTVDALERENAALRALVLALYRKTPITSDLEPLLQQIVGESGSTGASSSSHQPSRLPRLLGSANLMAGLMHSPDRELPALPAIPSHKGQLVKLQNATEGRGRQRAQSVNLKHEKSQPLLMAGLGVSLDPHSGSLDGAQGLLTVQDDTLCDVQRGPLLRKQSSKRSPLTLSESIILSKAHERAREEMDNSKRQLDLILEELTQLNLIEVCPFPVGNQRKLGENNVFYRFKQNIFCEVIRDNILPSWSKKIHELIAIWYETNLNLAPDNIAKYLAIHWKKAENTKKAIIYYAKAAENFIRVHCYRDATMFLGKANLLHASLKSIDDITDNMNNFIKWNRLLGHCYYNLGEMDKSLEHALKALELLGERLPSNINTDDLKLPELAQFKSIEKTGTVMSQGKKTVGGPVKINKSLKLSLPAQIEEGARCFHVLAQCYMFMSKRSEFLYCALKAMTYTEQSGAITKDFVNSIGFLIFCAGLCRKPERAKFYIHIGSSIGEGALYWKNCLLLYSGLGDMKLASDYCQKLSDDYATFGMDARIIEETFIAHSFNLYSQGKLDDSQAFLSKVLKTSSAREDLQVQALVHLLQANLQYSRGNLTRFYEDMDSFQTIFSPGLGYIMDPLSQLIYPGLMAIKYMKQSMYNEALEAALEVDRLWESTSPLFFFTFIFYYYSILVRVLLYKRIVEGKYKLADTASKEDKSINKKYFSALKKSVDSFDQFSETFTVAKPTVYILLGLMAQLTPSSTGQKNQDREILNKGLQEAAVRNMEYYVAVIHHWIGYSAGINDSPEVVKGNLMHQDKAFNLFLDLHVHDTMLLWHS